MKLVTPPLWIATSRGHLGMLTYLMQSPFLDTNYLDISGLSPYLAATAYRNKDTVKALAQDRRVRTDCLDYYGMTALALAVLRHHEATVYLILDLALCDPGKADL